MKWLKENGCPWDTGTFTYATRNGNLENINWLKENGFSWNTQILANAALNGNQENMKWLMDNDVIRKCCEKWKFENYEMVEG